MNASEKRWCAVSWGRFVHVLPLDDLYPHLPDGCECCPRVDEVVPTLVVHRSYDRREYAERGEVRP